MTSLQVPITGDAGGIYTLLRHLTLPIVAVTSAAGGRRNGMIANSAQRASLVPSLPRLSLYVSKPNYTHGLIRASMAFAVHLLRDDQWEIIERLGLRSGRDVPDKLDGLATFDGETGCPILSDARASFECRVINTMDAGAATFVLGDIIAVRDSGDGTVMTSEHFRRNAPPRIRTAYERLLAEAQAYLEPLARNIERTGWPPAGEER